jgi:tetratricopeptide (TPR) repeat protein
VLVLLDNAVSADQVRPLLPAGAECMAVVTSRADLDVHDGPASAPVRLHALAPQEAVALLGRALGARRVRREGEAAAEVARLCAYLPLALRIAAANIGDRTPIGAYAKRLAASGPLAALAVDDDPRATVRAAFDLSYARLSGPAQRAFRLLGLAPGADITATGVASLAGVDAIDARRVIDELTSARLLEQTTPGRYGCHDLLRAYSVDLYADDPAEERARAQRRLVDHYVHSACAAARVIGPHRDPISLDPSAPGVTIEPFAGEDEAVGWLAAERPALLTAAGNGDGTSDADVVRLAWALNDYLDRRGHWQDLATIHAAALASARRLGDPDGQARAHRNLARASIRLGRLDEAEAHLRLALDSYGPAGDPAHRAHTHQVLSWLFEERQRFADALEHAEATLRLFRAAAHRPGEARALNMVGWYFAFLDRPDRALTYCRQAIDLQRALGDRSGQANTWDSIGYISHQLGAHDQAVESYQRSLDLYQEIGDRSAMADVLIHLGEACRSAGDVAGARAAWRQAVDILAELDHAGAERVRAKLAALEPPG